MNKQIIQNAIQTPDETILISHFVHDYQEHIDKNGLTYSINGGNEYLKRSCSGEYKDLTLYSTDSIADLKYKLIWGTNGTSGKDPVKWVFLKDCTKEHLNNIHTLLFKRQLEAIKKDNPQLILKILLRVITAMLNEGKK